MGLSIEILSPENSFAKDAKMVILPGIEGDFAVLKGHTNFITAVKPGKLKVNYENVDEYVKVGFGLVSVTSNKVTVITEKLKYDN